MVADVSEEGCRSLAEEIEAAGGVMGLVAGDLREKAYCERVVAETVERFGGIDILVNNAGIIPRGTILETSDDMWHAAIGVNLTAMFYLCRAAIPHMKERGGGAIVNTSSVWGVYPGPQHLAYCTSKGAVACFTKSFGARSRAGWHPRQRCLSERDQYAHAALWVRASGTESAEGYCGTE